MKTVYKQVLDINDDWQEIPNHPLHFQEQYGQLVVWFEHDHANPGSMVPHQVRIYGTGHPIERGAQYVASCVMLEGRLVWHLYTK